MSQVRTIVDAHHHLWDLDACHYPWLMEKGVRRFFGDPTPIQRNYLVGDLLVDAADYELAGSVHVQVGVAEGDELRESLWLDATADASGMPSAMVAFCDLSRDDAENQLEQQRSIGRVRGIRHIVGRSAEEDRATGSDELLASENWCANLAKLPALDLSFDLQMIPPQAPRVVQLLEGIPDLRVAVCHCGSPWDQSADGLVSWREGMRRLAKNPNVFCKISGLAMFDHTWSIDRIRPIVEECIALFSPQRCMFGSNFPVDKLHKSWSEVWGAYERIAAAYSDTEQAMLFAGTARRFYGLDSGAAEQPLPG